MIPPLGFGKRSVNWILCCLLLLWLPAMCPAQGKGQGVEVRAVGSKLQDTAPGRILSIGFLVTNKTANEEEFIENIQLPAGWLTLIPVGSFRLNASGATTRLMAFQVPLSAPAGRYEVTYGIRGQRDYAIQDSDSLTVVVTPVTNLDLLVMEQPASVIAGETYSLRLQLINQSNVELHTTLSVSSDEKYPAEIEPSKVTLAVGDSIPLEVTVQTNADEQRPRKHFVRINALATGTDTSEIIRKIAVGVDIIPRISGKLDMYHRLPVDVTLHVDGKDGHAGVQVEVRGAGSLDEVGRINVEFLFRTPDTQKKGTFGQRDEYMLNYFTEDLGVKLGDQSYGLSELTSYYRYGRGLGIDYHPTAERTTFGAHFLNERWSRPDQQQYGLYVAHEMNEKITPRVNFLHKERKAYDGRPSTDENLVSIEAAFRPRDDMNLEVEYGFCDSNRRGETDDTAYRIELDGKIGRDGYYRAAKFHAGPDYYGYYNDSDYSYVSLTYPLAPRLHANASFNRYRRNLEQRPDQSTAERETLWRGGVNYRFDGGWYASLDFDDFERTDWLMPSAYDFSEQALRLGIGRSAQNYSFRTEVRRGNQEDHLTGQSRTAWNYNIFSSYRLRQDTTFTLYAGFGDDKALDGSRLLRTSNNLGASVNWNPSSDLSMDFWYSKYNFDDNARSESDQYSFNLRQRLSNSHQLVLRARHNTGAARENETSYELAYTIPLSLSVSKKKSVGSIRGRVYDAEISEHPGVAGVILRINEATAVSDRNGEFVFPSVAPGTYQIDVDRASIGLERVTEQKLPLPAQVVGGEVMALEVGLVRGAKLVGKVLVMPASASANGNGNGNGNGHTIIKGDGAFVVGEPGTGNVQKEPTGLPNVLVELTNEQEVLRRVTDSKGEFLFESVRPSLCHLKVYGHNIPAYYELSNPEQDLTLELGQTEEVTIRVLPKTRQIRFIDKGAIRPNGNNEQPALRPVTPDSGKQAHLNK